MQTPDIQAKIDAQTKYCNEHKAPHFAPSDGVCWNCRKQIYSSISLEKADTELVTGCPYCFRSYCD